MGTLTNKVVWITGASSGIGEALAYAMAAKGARLILSARRKEELERVKGNCDPKAQPDVRILPFDLSQAETLQLTTEAAIQIFGHIDILVNNGGISQRSFAKDTIMDVYRRLMEVNFFGPVAVSKYLLPHFLNRKAGHYVTISSITGKFGTPYRSGYAASKHALHGFFDSLRAELYKDVKEAITVSMICPGFIRTALTLSAVTGDGTPLRKMDAAQFKGKPAEWCAERIVKAIEQKKQETYIGGIETLGVQFKRFFPRLFSKYIRNAAVR
nr:short chain dehydrogenase [uncultured bacterium]